MALDASPLGLKLFNRYQIDSELARGALCRVYRGQDIVLRRSIAIKAVEPDLIPVYRAALHASAAFTHPAVVATYDAIEHDGYLYLVQEYVPARALGSYIQAGIPSERVVDLGGQLARALAYAHAHDLAHGDLTPAAVLVDRKALVRMNNFGLPPDADYFERAVASVTLGAVAAPTASPDGDMTALGLLLWQVLSELVSDMPRGDAQLSARRTFRQDVPDEVREVVLRCMLSDRADRFQDAESLAIALEALAQDLSSRRPAMSEQTPPALRIARDAVAREASWSVEQTIGSVRPWAQADDARHEFAYAPTDPSSMPASTWSPQQTPLTGPPRMNLPVRTGATAGPRFQTPSPAYHPNVSVGLRDQPTYESGARRKQGGISTLTVALIFVGLFIIFFLIGFFGPSLLHG